MKTLTLRAFYPKADQQTAEMFLHGHVKVLEEYGITNITSNNKKWTNWDNVYGIVAEDEEGTVVGGIRIQLASEGRMLPVELAIGKMDPSIHEVVKSYFNDGVGELCALWNSKSIAGHGISLLLTRAGISVTNQVSCKTLMGICADYTMPMFRRVGFVVNGDLGDKGEFMYPNANYVARVLGILNAKDLDTAEKIDQERMLSLRNTPNQEFLEVSPKGEEVFIHYKLKLNI